MMTQKKIAEMLGISRTTVARALQENSSIKEETRKKVLDLIQETKYEKNYLGSSLAGRKKIVHAFVVKSKNEFYTAEIQRGMQNIQQKYAKYRLEIQIHLHDIHQAQEQVAALENILSQEKQVDGILIVPLEKKKIYHVIKPHLKKIPVISLTMQLHSDIAHIGTDYHRQGRIVANILAHCLRKGESLIILDNGDDKLSTRDYLEGFCERISEEELDILGPYSCQGIQESVELLKKLSQEKKIRGVFSNRYAQDIMKELPDSWFVGKHIVVNGMSEEIEQLLLEKKVIATVTEEVYEEASFAGKLLFQTLYQNKKIPKIWSKTNSKIIYLENLEKK